MRKWVFFLLLFFALLCFWEPSECYAQALPNIDSPPDLKVVEPQVKEWAKEAVESGMNEKGYNINFSPEFTFFAFLDLNL